MNKLEKYYYFINFKTYKAIDQRLISFINR